MLLLAKTLVKRGWARIACWRFGHEPLAEGVSGDAGDGVFCIWCGKRMEGEENADEHRY